MKKLLLGLGLEERIATCNFCGEQHKECIRGSLPFRGIQFVFEVKRVPKNALEYICTGFFFGKYKYACDDYEYRKVVVEEKEVDLGNADICKDCIRQLSKLIKD